MKGNATYAVANIGWNAIIYFSARIVRTVIRTASPAGSAKLITEVPTEYMAEKDLT